MTKTSIIGLDLAKRVFQAHGACADGGVAFRKKLSREKVLAFLAQQPRCVAAMEACGSAHYWGRAIRDLGHEVRLIPPLYVKPFVKRQKNGAAGGGDRGSGIDYRSASAVSSQPPLTLQISQQNDLTAYDISPDC